MGCFNFVHFFAIQGSSERIGFRVDVVGKEGGVTDRDWDISNCGGGAGWREVGVQDELLLESMSSKSGGWRGVVVGEMEVQCGLVRGSVVWGVWHHLE